MFYSESSPEIPQRPLILHHRLWSVDLGMKLKHIDGDDIYIKIPLSSKKRSQPNFSSHPQTSKEFQSLTKTLKCASYGKTAASHSYIYSCLLTMCAVTLLWHTEHTVIWVLCYCSIMLYSTCWPTLTTSNTEIHWGKQYLACIFMICKDIAVSRDVCASGSQLSSSQCPY